MIGTLRGEIAALGDAEAVIEVHGAGYLFGAGARTLRRLAVGESAYLHVETEMREDAIRLWAFLSEEERAWFVRLRSVQGVGAKAALAILDVLTPAELMSAAALGDVTAIARAQGVGKKLAERVAGELKDKPPPQGRALTGALPGAPAGLPVSPATGAQADAISALLNLGYQRGEAAPAVAAAARALGEGAAVDALIGRALKELAHV